MTDRDALDVLVLAGPPPVRSGAPRFRALPLVAVPTGNPAPAGSQELARRTRYSLDRLRLLQAIDWLLTVPCDVANLSLGPRPWRAFDPLDPLHVATRALYDHGIPVVVAAGNDGPDDGTLRELARAPWVIAVGATDADGHLLSSSSRGEPGGPAPTVVSDGTHPEEPVPGTSFAAPRVARAALFARKCFEYLLGSANWLRSTERDPLGPVVRLPWTGIVDTGWDPKKSPYEWGPLARSLIESGADGVQIGLLPEEERWLDCVLVDLGAGARDFTLDAGPETVRRALVAMARPVAGAPHEVGAGSVTIGDAIDFFGALTPSRLAAVLLPGDELARRQLAPHDEELGPLWDGGKLQLLEEYFVTGVRFSAAKAL